MTGFGDLVFTAMGALVVTIVVELPLYVLALVGLRLVRPARAVLLAIGLNLLTHPVLWHVLAPDPTIARVVLAEVCVVVVEAAVIRLFVRRDTVMSLVVSLGVNAASFGVGMMINGAVGA